MSDPKQDSTQGIRRLVDWGVGVRLTDISPAVLARGARILADNMSAIIAARNEPEVANFHKLMISRTERIEATIYRGGMRQCDRYSAAVANGVAAEWLELAEGYRKAPCHAGAYVVPVLLSEAEADGRTVGELLRALVVSYELVTRIARAWVPPDMLMQPHARYASIGAAAAATLIRRMRTEDVLSAFTAACTLVFAGPRNHAVMGALVRNVWPAVGTWCGLMCADWARCGIGGVPEGPYEVFTDLLHATARPEQLTADLGVSWAVMDGYAKIHACCQHAHSAVEATQELRATLLAQGSLPSVAKVLVETHAGAMMLTNYRPATTLATKFSVPHIIAATLVTGHAGVEEFTHSAMHNPDIERMRDMVEMKLYEPKLIPPNDRPARVTAVLHSGQTVAAECLSARGGPDRPFPEAVIWRKIVDLAEPAYPNFRPVFESIIALEEARLTSSWSDIISALGCVETPQMA